MSLYKKILSESWRATWKHKYLWFFGLFAAFLELGGEYNMLFSNFSRGASREVFPFWHSLANTGIFSGQALKNIGLLAKEEPLSILSLTFIFLVIIVLICFIAWLAITSQVGLVNNASNHLTGKKDTGDDFKSGIKVGIKNFWPVFTLNVAAKIMIFIGFLIICVPVISSAANMPTASVDYTYILLFIVLIPIILSISFIIKYAIAYIVIKEKKLKDAIKDGYQLFSKNWLISLEMAFIQFFISFIGGMLILLIILTLAIPFTLLFYFSLKYISTGGFWFIFSFAMMIMVVIVVLAGSIISTFQTISWTKLFLELVGKGGTSKILRIAEDIKQKITN